MQGAFEPFQGVSDVRVRNRFTSAADRTIFPGRARHLSAPHETQQSTRPHGLARWLVRAGKYSRTARPVCKLARALNGRN